MKRARIFTAVICLLLVAATAINLSGCAIPVQAADLMEGIEASAVSGKAPDESFISAQMRLYADLFAASASESKGKNVLISPLSVTLALAMTANGARGETLTEMETLLGGDIDIGELNEYLYSYVKFLPSGDGYKLNIANSIWLRNDNRLTVEKDFLQTNANYYGAEAYKSAFDAQTLKDINNWVSGQTDGMIDSIIEKIGKDEVMYLINALCFDAKWENVYTKEDVRDGSFTALSGEERETEMMNSEESRYLESDTATGFIKNYKGGAYSFAALLPNEGVDIYDYIASLSGEELNNTLQSETNERVDVTMPKFSYDYELIMNDVLAVLGMPTAFDGIAADFSGIGKSTSGNLYIGEVLHKTFISVDELGTKAGAVTKVAVGEMAMVPVQTKTVILDRPFVYMIIDEASSLPVFIGVVTDIG